MNGPDEPTPQGGRHQPGMDAPTEVLPAQDGRSPDPTLPLPVSPWSRPDPAWASPDESTRVSWAQPGGGQPQSHPGSMAGGGYDPGRHGHSGAQPMGYAGHLGYGQPSGPGYGPPQHPVAQPPVGYPPPTPVQAPRKGRGFALALALLLAFVLAGAGTGWATRSILGGEQPAAPATQPQLLPSTPADPEPGGSEEPGETGPGRTSNPTTSGEVAAAESAGVVLIEARSSAGLGAGTGMVLSADGKVLTNYHVVAGSEKLQVTVADSGDTYAATVIGFDQARDVALIQLEDASGLATVRTDLQVPDVGAKVAAVGNAQGGGELVKAAGRVTATDQDLTVSSDSPWGNTEDLSGLIQTDARAVPGDSGGPMFDSDQEVIGITTAGSTRERTSYAVPIATALQVVQQIETGQDAGTTRVGPAGYLGIKVDDEQAGNGKTITEVVAGSPAAKAGLTSGSRLIQVGGTTIRSSTNLATVIRALEPGEQVRVVWTTPNGTQKTATVTLGSSPVA